MKKDYKNLNNITETIWQKNLTPWSLATRLKLSSVSYQDVATALMTSPQNIFNYCKAAIERENVAGSTEIYLFLRELAEKGMI